MIKKGNHNVNNVIILEKYRQQKTYEENSSDKRIKVKIKSYEIETILCCIFFHSEFLKNKIKLEVNKIHINRLKNNIVTLEKMYEHLRERLGKSKGSYLNLSKYNFEMFLNVIELELEPYLDFETGKWTISDDCDADYCNYLKILKIVYDRLNAKYLNLIEPKIYSN